MKKTWITKPLSIVLTFVFALSILTAIPFKVSATYEAYFLDGTIAKEATFILDPGHGGDDNGALADPDENGNRREEADDNLSMALKVAAELEARGETVALTRITDKTVALIDRSHISNSGKYDIFCSLHRNSADNKGARGIETFYFNGITAESSSAKIAAKVHEKAIAVSPSIVDRKVKNANFSVLRETYTCAILIESLFMSNEADNVLYDEIESKLAVAYAEGLIESKEFATPDYYLDKTYAPQDLGDSFVAAITLPYANLALTNNGDFNTIASATNYSDSQLWKFEKLDSRNAYKITSLLDNNCLDIASAGTANATNVMVWEDNGANCQKYYLYSIYGKYCIRPMHCTNDRVLDINAVSLNAQIYDLNLTNPNQQFTIEKIGDSSEDNSNEESSDDILENSSLELVANSKYLLEDNYITKVKANTTAEAFAENFKNEVIIKNSSGDEISLGQNIGTGYIVFDKNSEDNATVIILGDVNGDGELTATDYLQIKSFFLSIGTLEGAYYTAANVDEQGGIDATDYIKVKSHFLGNTDIYA